MARTPLAATFTGSSLRSLVNDLADAVDVLEGAVAVPDLAADGVTDDAAALSAALAAGNVWIASGNVYLASNVTGSTGSNLRVARGARITVASGVTLTLRGGVEAGDYPIFYGAGTVDLNEGSRVYNVAWWDGATLDAKWDAMRRGFLDLFRYNVTIPQPQTGDPAAGSTTDPASGRTRLYWKLAASLEFSDPENRMRLRVDGAIQATAAMTDMLVFSPDALKTEDIILDGRLDLIGTGFVTNAGILIRGGARLKFPAEVNITGCPKAIEVAAYLPVSFCEFADIYAGEVTDSLLHLHSESTAINGFAFGTLTAAAAQSTSAQLVKVIGDVRSLRIRSMFYLTDATGVDVDAMVYLEAATAGRPVGVTIGQVYAQSATTGIKARQTGGASRIENLDIGPVYPSTTAGRLAYDLQWVGYSTMRGTDRNSDITLGTNCLRVRLDGMWRTLSKNAGGYNIINGLILEALGAGATPSTSNTKTGDQITNASDGVSWVKVSETGVAGTDFVAI